jgi:hypothetical protein
MSTEFIVGPKMFEGLEATIARIESTHLGYEDHGIFSLNVSFDYGGGSGQGTDHCVCSADSNRLADVYGIRLVKAICDAAGVSNWESLKGRTVFVYRDPGWNGMVRGIGPIPTEKGTPFLIADITEGALESRECG